MKGGVTRIVNPTNKAWMVVASIRDELERQMREGGLSRVGSVNTDGQVHVDGLLDIAALADAAERALRARFGR